MVFSIYLQVPDRTRAALSDIVSRFDPADPNLVFRVADYVRSSAVYDTDTEAMHELGDFVPWFLTESDRGYCVHFASAAVLLLRCLGVPARYVTGYLVRAEGSAVTAFLGVSFGGVLNIILDPFFVLPRFLGRGAVGAGEATAISNLAAAVFFLVYIMRGRDRTVLRADLKLLRYAKQYLKGILSVGFPSAVQLGLTVVAVAAQARFVAKYPTEAVAALGIVKNLVKQRC
jgi:hypothetical protein